MSIRQRRQQVQVKLTIPFVGEVSGSWEPDDAEQLAAWELYVELVTRISLVPLAVDQGLAREALTSLYALFGVTRDILRRHGPAVAPARGGQLSVGFLAVGVLNGWLRPLLTAWHPRLADHEARRPPDTSAVEWERGWPHTAELRHELDSVRGGLLDYARQLAKIAHSSDLIGAAAQRP